MAILGTIRGEGILYQKREKLGGVRYEITVMQDQNGGLKSATGHLFGDDGMFLKTFMSRGACQLALTSGETVELIINRHTTGDGRAFCTVSGRVPGF